MKLLVTYSGIFSVTLSLHRTESVYGSNYKRSVRRAEMVVVGVVCCHLLFLHSIMLQKKTISHERISVNICRKINALTSHNILFTSRFWNKRNEGITIVR